MSVGVATQFAKKSGTLALFRALICVVSFQLAKGTFMKKIVCLLTLIGFLSGAAFSQSRMDKERARLLQVDAEFSDLSVKKGAAAAFAAYLADEAIFLPSGENPISGRQGIVDYFSRGEYTLTWKPLKADVAESGEIGYTYGISELKSGEGNGTAQVRHYKYVSVLRKQKTGEWKLVLDIGNQNPAPTR